MNCADLTPQQNRILAFIGTFMATNGYPPTRAEIAKAFLFQSPNAAHQHLQALERKGHIRLIANTARGIQLTAMPTEQISMLDVMANPNLPARPVLSLKS